MSEESQKLAEEAAADQQTAEQQPVREPESAEEQSSATDAVEQVAAEEDAVVEAGDEADSTEGDSGEDVADEVAEDVVEEEEGEDEGEDEGESSAMPAVEPEPPAPAGPAEMDWYILKVQSNRERSIADALRRKIKIEGLDDLFGDVIVPTEKVTEFKGGKKKVVERKLYPGYIVVHMHINDDTWFAVRETSGIGDFTGSGGKPTPMLPHEVTRIIHTEEEETDEAPKLDIKFKLEDKVKVKDGTFEGFEGEVSAIDEQSGKITVMLSIFGRSTPVELEYWQVEGV